MDTKQEIILRYFREGDSERKISRDLHVSRKTIKRYLVVYLSSKQKAEGEKSKALHECLTKPPKYDSTNRHKRKLTEELCQEIDRYIEENQVKRANGMRKQMMKKSDIYEALLSKGFQIGYTSVCLYISSKLERNQEAFIRQEYFPGEECEFDWAEVKLRIQGEIKRLYLAVFTSGYSNYRYGRLYHRQDSLAFMESHIEFFNHLGGVYQEMVYDNMRVAIAEFVGKTEKRPTQALLQLSG